MTPAFLLQNFKTIQSFSGVFLQDPDLNAKKAIKKN